ncbi:hypothetical protein Syun_007524 [Stephania yunnanensis]|uniref:JmjC domain-containing protein n=1 Tax=Stephania yunnanensis TaxID=152371 RepID=A0AAP0PYT1_9MAGN
MTFIDTRSERFYRRRLELTQATPDQPVDDEAVYLNVADAGDGATCRVRCRCRAITKGYGVYALAFRDDHGRSMPISATATTTTTTSYQQQPLLSVEWFYYEPYPDPCRGIEPRTFVQQLGEAVFIPAGCPHQVRNLKLRTFLIRNGLSTLFKDGPVAYKSYYLRCVFRFFTDFAYMGCIFIHHVYGMPGCAKSALCKEIQSAPGGLRDDRPIQSLLGDLIKGLCHAFVKVAELIDFQRCMYSCLEAVIWVGDEDEEKVLLWLL